MKSPHRLAITIAKKRYLSGLFDITPKEFTHREIEMILGQDFKAWIANNRFTPESPWKIECLPDDAPNYDVA